jgi:PAS domain S-box-containing protein
MAADLIQKHEIILDSISEGVFTVDLHYRITSFNKAAEQITGIPRSQALGRFCFEVLRADVCETGCVIRRTIATQQALRGVPVHIYTNDKRLIPICVNTALLKDADNRVIGGVENFMDMSAIQELQKALQKTHTFEDIVSKNPKMHRIFGLLPQVAESGSTVLIQGDSGTGKELVARAIHNQSPRRKGPFIAVNCGALPDALIESELFGYMAGAFTDARRDKPGRFTMAQNGTIFLDEIGDITPAVQVRLLRVLQQQTYEPLGSSRSMSTNARVIAATHRDLNGLVQQGAFRDDLFYRINVFKIALPRLADRQDDIPLLVEFFIDRFNRRKGRSVKGLSREAINALLHYRWPGNVRELENAIEHAFVLCADDIIRIEDLPDHLIPVSTVPAAGATLKDIERAAIVQTLRRHRGGKMATARELGIDKNTLRRKMIRLGLVA